MFLVSKFGIVSIIFILVLGFVDTYVIDFFRELYDKIVNKVRNLKNERKKGKEKNIYYISSKMMLGSDREATVDGIHFTDVGMMRYADLVTPVIKKLLKK